MDPGIFDRMKEPLGVMGWRYIMSLIESLSKSESTAARSNRIRERSERDIAELDQLRLLAFHAPRSDIGPLSMEQTIASGMVAAFGTVDIGDLPADEKTCNICHENYGLDEGKEKAMRLPCGQ